MSYDGIYGSEDAYYEMDEQSLEYFIDDIIYDLKYKKKYSNKKHKIKLNRYSRKKITQQKYEKLDYITRNYHYAIDYDEDKQRYIRMYFSRHRKFAHKQTERKVRKSNDFKLKGGGYRKVYNYWDTVC